MPIARHSLLLVLAAASAAATAGQPALTPTTAASGLPLAPEQAAVAFWLAACQSMTPVPVEVRTAPGTAPASFATGLLGLIWPDHPLVGELATMIAAEHRGA